MIKLNGLPKITQTNAWSFILAFVALTSVQISYVLGGLAWLDCFVFLLVPSFIFFLVSLFRPWDTETRDYCVGLTLVIVCIALALSFKFRIEVGTIDDNYHNAKIVALSMKNNFFTEFQLIKPVEDIRLSLIEFIESVWAIFWRWTRWDFIVTISQALPILVLWHQLLQFFRKQKVTTTPALLAAVTVIASPLLWAQQGSTYNDSIAGIFGAIALLVCYDLLKYPSERNFSSLVGLAFISGLCLVSKSSLIFVGLLGMLTAFGLGLRSLPAKAKWLLPWTALPSIVYFLYHQGLLWIRKGTPVYPLDTSSHLLGQEFHSWVHYYYESDPLYAWIRDHAFSFKPLYVLASWLMDYKFDSYITADPYVRGNGLVFTYFVVPALLIWLIKDLKNIFKYGNWKNPCLLILGVTIIYYVTFSGSVGSRFSLCFNILILAWCLSWAWRNIEQWPAPWAKISVITLICILLVLTTVSYDEAILGRQYEQKIFSPLEAQRKMFPQFLLTGDFRKELIQHLYALSHPSQP